MRGAETDRELLSEMIHGFSQPVTALECGLELSLCRDNDVAQLRARVESALTTTKILHQRVAEYRMLADAGDPGDTTEPVAIDRLLLQLREDFRPLADAAGVRGSVRCKPALVHGNCTRLRDGFFHLFEFLIGDSPPHHSIELRAVGTRARSLTVRFE